MVKMGCNTGPVEFWRGRRWRIGQSYVHEKCHGTVTAHQVVLKLDTDAPAGRRIFLRK